MSKWIKQLEEIEKLQLAKAMRREQDDDGDEDDGDGDEDDGDGDGYVNDGEEEEKPVKKGISGTSGTPKGSKKKGCYPPAEQGEDADPNDEESTNQSKAKVRGADSLFKKTRQGGSGKMGWGAKTPIRKSLEDLVSEDASEAIEVSDVLTELAKGIAVLSEQNADATEALAERVSSLEKGIGAIGRALVVSLQEQNSIAKSLASQVEDLGRQPAGRRGIVKGIEKRFTQNESAAGGQQLDRKLVMKKAVSALKKGGITPHDITKLESDFARGVLNQEAWARVQAALEEED